MSKIETIYLVHHSHTDVGYTHDQPVVLDLHTRFIDTAIDLAERSADSDSDGAFRWTVETTTVLNQWLKNATSRDIERFIAMERAGRIEVTGMFTNLTPLMDADQLIESFLILRKLREEYGFNISSAMNCDVNGENWSLVDVLLDLGIRGFSMAINTHFGGAVSPRPFPFYWEAPSGRKMLAYNGWTYDKGLHYGIGRNADDLKNVWLPRVESYLDRINYPLPILMLQAYHPYGDNGSAYNNFTPFIDAWNRAGNTPRIVFATPRIWWDAVEKHAHLITTYRGDWTDYWNFGSISSVREQAINRASRSRLRSADAAFAALNSLPDGNIGGRKWAANSFQRYRQNAWDMLNLWDEHTWGADISLRAITSDDTASQWNHKAHYAYEARALSLMLQRDAVAELAQHVTCNADDDILMFNALPWARKLGGSVPHFTLFPRGVKEDTTAARHHQDRDDRARWGQDDAGLILPAIEVPAYGYTVVPRASLVKNQVKASEDAIVENDLFRLKFDREKGGLLSFYDKQQQYEWVEQGAHTFNGYVHEEVADKNSPWARNLLAFQDWGIAEAEIPRGWHSGWRAKRSKPENVVAHTVYKTAIGYEIVQKLDAPGIDGKLIQRIFLPDGANYIECASEWDMPSTTHPEARYITFPFNLPDATARFDIGGQPVIPEQDQLPGACRDYFTVQGWVDFAGQGRGVTIAVPENPMVQLGDFHFGHNQAEFQLERALLLGWVTNNYWETNFRAHQPGRVASRYRILPYQGAFNESRAHRFALEAAYNSAIYQHMGEPKLTTSLLPQTASLLQLPELPIMTLHVKAAPANAGVLIRLLNASEKSQKTKISSGLLKITDATVCDLLEKPGEALKVIKGAVSIDIPARRFVTLRLKTIVS